MASTEATPTGSTVLVTGASAGIGRELARDFAARGWDLLLVARSEEPLRDLAREVEEAHGVTAHVLPCDLAHPDGPDRVAAAVGEMGLRIEILVNNAGFGQFGPYPDLDPERERDQLMLNVVALTRLTRLLLPPMLERASGRILNVASIAAFFPGPLMAVYYATKAYVLSYSLALAEELGERGVSVTCLCPGPTRTRFQEAADMEGSGLFRMGTMTPEQVAEEGVRATLAGKRMQVTGRLNRLAAFSSRLAPRRLATGAVRRLQAERG